MSKNSTSTDFNTTCDLFCHLANNLEKDGYQDISDIIDHLMSVWLSLTLVK